MRKNYDVDLEKVVSYESLLSAIETVAESFDLEEIILPNGNGIVRIVLNYNNHGAMKIKLNRNEPTRYVHATKLFFYPEKLFSNYWNSVNINLPSSPIKN